MKHLRRHLFSLAFLLGTTGYGLCQSLVINEWMAKNSTGIADEDGDHSDWVELYNGTNTAINLAGYGISDDETLPYKWVFPTVVIPPDGFLLVFCSGKDRNVPPHLHTGFKLSKNEDLVLTDPFGNQVDEKEVGQSVFDVSEGYILDGLGGIEAFYQATPGASNLNGRIHDKIHASHPSGFYSASFNLNVISPEGNDIHYTLDGSEPELSDPIWTSALPIDDRTSEPESISLIPTNGLDLGEALNWETPDPDQFKGTVIRLRSFEAGLPTSHTLDLSYFVHPLGADRYSLPVVSVLTDSLNLFDYDSGVYVPGLVHDQNPGGGGVWGTGNYHEEGDDWERRAHVQLFNDNGIQEISQNVGLRIHGKGSRALAQKSLRFYAREKYGESKLRHMVFPELETDEFDVVVLRNMGQDFLTGVAQDVLAHQLVKHLDQAALASRPVVTFINGEYWGIANLRERFDKHFLSQFHELDEDSIDLIDNYYGAVGQGDNVAWFELYDFVVSSDLSEADNYAWVASKMDISDFIDNKLTKIFLGCYDWPGNNVKIWRERSPSGRFRWLLLDNDMCLGDADFNSLEHATFPDNTGWPNPQESTLLLRKLLENDGFKEQFILRMAELLNTSFDASSVGTKLSRLYDTYAPEYAEHNNRWKALDSGQTLEGNYEDVLEAIRTRGCHVRAHFMEFFELTEAEFPNACDSTSLELDVPDLSVRPNPNCGTFDVLIAATDGSEVHLTLYDLSGRLVHRVKTVIRAQEEFRMRPTGLSQGMYILRASWGEHSLTEKILVQ